MVREDSLVLPMHALQASERNRRGRDQGSDNGPMTGRFGLMVTPPRVPIDMLLLSMRFVDRMTTFCRLGMFTWSTGWPTIAESEALLIWTSPKLPESLMTSPWASRARNEPRFPCTSTSAASTNSGWNDSLRPARRFGSFNVTLPSTASVLGL